MITIITDQPSIAKQIALSLEMDVKTESAGYFQGRGFRLVWADKDLLSLLPPANRLAKSDLPFLPETFALAVRKNKTTQRAPANHAAVRQLGVIRKAFDESESLIVATDAGENGEWTFRTIYSFLQCEKPFARLWLNSLAASAIRKGAHKPQDGAPYDRFYAAADCRRKADFLTAINAGSAFSLATGLVNCPLGRLEIPVLAMVCRRFGEYRRFAPDRFHAHRIRLGKDGLFQCFALPGSIKSRRRAGKIYERLKTLHTARITKVEIHSRIQAAPMPYNLTALQAEAHFRYGFPVRKTMEIARKLYEAKLVSYPLTDSRRIPEKVLEAIPKILRRTAGYCNLTDSLSSMDMENLNRRNVREENALPWEHYALIPIGTCPGYLTKEEKTIYEMIACRALEAFAPDCRKELIRVEAAFGNLVLVSEKSKIAAPGWRSIRNGQEDREADEVRLNEVLPSFTEGETVRVSGCNLLAYKTMPEPLHTERSLLLAMEEAGLGTAETRSPVIESLVSCGYIEQREQYLMPSEKGQVVYNCVKDMRIADVQQAGGWERMIAGIREGKQTADTFMTAFKIFTRQATQEILGIQKPAPGKRRDKEE
jgi:DNA topoisomerase-3